MSEERDPHERLDKVKVVLRRLLTLVSNLNEDMARFDDRVRTLEKAREVNDGSIP